MKNYPNLQEQKGIVDHCWIKSSSYFVIGTSGNKIFIFKENQPDLIQVIHCTIQDLNQEGAAKVEKTIPEVEEDSDEDEEGKSIKVCTEKK